MNVREMSICHTNIDLLNRESFGCRIFCITRGTFEVKLICIYRYMNDDSRNSKIWGKLKTKMEKCTFFLHIFLREEFIKLRNVDLCTCTRVFILSLLHGASWFISKEADTEALPLLCNEMTWRVRIQVLTSSLNAVHFIA